MKRFFCFLLMFLISLLLIGAVSAYTVIGGGGAGVVDVTSTPAPTLWITLTSIFAALWTASECLAQISAIKGNSVFQLIASLLAKIGQPSANSALIKGPMEENLPSIDEFIGSDPDFTGNMTAVEMPRVTDPTPTP